MILLATDGLPGLLKDLDRPNRPLEIVRVNSQCGVGIDALQPSPAFVRRQILHVLSKFIIRSRAVHHSEHQRLNVQVRAADDNRPTTSLSNVCNGLIGQFQPAIHAECIVGWVDDIHQMMGYSGPLRNAGFSRANVHGSKDLHGISANALTPSGESLGQSDCQGGFAAGGRTQNEDGWQRSGHSAGDVIARARGSRLRWEIARLRRSTTDGGTGILIDTNVGYGCKQAGFGIDYGAGHSLRQPPRRVVP